MPICVPSSDCTRAREAASARLDGELTELEAFWLDTHVSGCADCRGYAAAIAGISASLRAAPLERPDVELFSARRQRPRAVPLATAAAVALIAAVGISSFAAGALSGRRTPGPPITGVADLPSVRADSTQQHILAMLPRPAWGSVAPGGRGVIAF